MAVFMLFINLPVMVNKDFQNFSYTN